jgi:beta-phosphoglucomutase-like phosphatase (HAD superfamily)
MVSNGSVEHVRTCLNLVNLLHDFQGKIFSSEQVDKPKPHPDVYLHAIGNLDLKPNQIVVVEDSPTGVQAAKYAGLRVIGFLGAAHIHDGHADVLSTNGADYIAPNAESLFKILSALGASFHPPRLESI